MVSYIVDMIDFCSYMLLKAKAKKNTTVAELFHNSRTKGERGKMTARIHGLIQGIEYKVARLS